MRAATVARIGLGGAGLAVAWVGARGLLEGHPLEADKPVGRWLLDGLVVHDAIIAPAVFVLCAIAYRVTSVRVRQALAAILLIGGSVTLVALPDILRKGHNANPTVTPLDYRRNLIIVLAAVVAGVLLATIRGSMRDKRRRGRPIASESPSETEPADGELEPTHTLAPLPMTLERISHTDTQPVVGRSPATADEPHYAQHEEQSDEQRHEPEAEPPDAPVPSAAAAAASAEADQS